VSDANRAASIYYSFYVRAEHRFANGLSILGSYTWSRSEDDITGLNGAGASQVTAIAGPQNAYNLHAEWSLSTQDAPNRFTMPATYELPLAEPVGIQRSAGDHVIREPIKAQFRAEALNATNTPYFGNPGTNVTNTATFGQITSQIDYPRLVQLGIRATF
jgi:hypothetical protein